MSDKGEVHEKENISPVNDPVVRNEPPRPRRRGCAGFLRKWWWLLLILIAIAVLVTVLPIIFVLVPKIIRDTINDSTLTVQGIHTLNTQTDSYKVEINTTITTSSSRKATIEGFSADLYLEDKLPHTPFVTVDFPTVHSSKVTHVNISQERNVTNEQAFADYNTWYLLNDTFRVTVDGWTHVKVSGLPSTKVHFKKTITLTGMNGFAGFNLTESTVSLLPDSQGDNFHGQVTIPNPSLLTVDIGNTTFQNFLNDTQIGTAFIDNLILSPGLNNYSIRANISQATILEAVQTQPFCNDGILPLTFVGQNITNFGQELPYFEAAFRTNKLTLNLNVTADLAQIGLASAVKCPSSSASSSAATASATAAAR